MKTALVIGVVVWAGTSAGAVAQTNVRNGQNGGVTPSVSRALAVEATGPALTLEEVLREALGNNADLASARRQIDPLRVRPSQATILAPPMLEAEIWQWPINSLNPARANMFMFTASQDLPGRGKRQAAALVAQTEIRVAESAVSVRERQIVATVAAAYWDLLFARQAIVIHLDNVDLLRQLTDVAQAKYAAGRSSQQDVLKAIIETTRLHDDLIDLEQQSAQSALRLNASMNRELDTPIGRLASPAESTIVVPLAELQALAAKAQPILQNAQTQVDRAQAQLRVARTAATPDWSIAGGYMVQPRETDGWLARVSVTWPRAPWSRRAIDARTAEAVATISAAEVDAAAMAVQVRLSVAEAYVRVKAAEERALLLRTTLLPQSRQALEASRVAYQNDRGDFSVVLENERTVLDGQLAYQRVAAEWRRALASLEAAVGATLPSSMWRPVPTEVQ
jgi:outer membrane protein, heavy metal efflux system